MKLLKITLYNLASFEGEQVIDLESEPLKSADLFSIVGETGSGKSTILDAICLALYGLAPRFYGADNFDYYHTEKPDSDKVLEPDDPRNILRKGAKECRAEVLFRARDGFCYRAVWSCSIARVNYTRPVRRLFRLQQDSEGNWGEVEVEITAGGRLRRGHKNVNNEALDRIIGLDYGQFTRTVMLAQNSFANFVKADDRDKAILLEKLTGTEFYTSIARQIYTFYKQAEADYNQLFEEVKAFSIHCLEETVLEEHNTRMGELDALLLQVHKKMDALKEAQTWYENLVMLQRAVGEEEQKWQQACSNSEALNGLRKELLRIEDVAVIRNLFQHAEMSSKEIDGLMEGLTLRKTTLSQLEEIVIKESNLLEGVRSEWTKRKCSWEEWQPRLAEARRLQVELKGGLGLLKKAQCESESRKQKLWVLSEERKKNQQELDNCLDSKRRAELLLQEWEVYRTMLNEMGAISERLSLLHEYTERYALELHIWRKNSEELQYSQREIKSMEDGLLQRSEELKQIQSEVDAKQKLFQSVDALRLQQELDEVAYVYKGWEQVENLYTLAIAMQKDRKELSKALAGDEHLLAGLELQVSVLQQEQEEILRVLPGLDEAYRLMSGRTASELRAFLKPETPCPVCGSLHHPYADGVEKTLEPVREQLNQKRCRLEEIHRLLEHVPDGLRLRLSSVKGEFAARQTRLLQLEEQWKGYVGEWEKLRGVSGDLPKDLEEVCSRIVQVDWNEWISCQKTQVVEKGKQLRAQQLQFLGWQNELVELQKRHDECMQQRQALQEKLHQSQVCYQQQVGKQEQKEKELQTLHRSITSLYLILDGQVNYPEWRVAFQNDAPGLIAKLKEMAIKYQDALAICQKVQVTIGECSAKVASLDKQRVELEQEQQFWLQEKLREENNCHQLEEAYKMLLGNRNPEEVELEMKRLLTQLEEQVNKQEKLLAGKVEECNRLKGMCQSDEMQIAAQRKALQCAQDEIDGFISQYNVSHLSDSDIEDKLTLAQLRSYFTNEVYWNEARTQVHQADEAVKLCMGRKEVHEKALQKHLEQGAAGGLYPQEAEGFQVRFLKERELILSQIEGLDRERQLIGGLLTAHRQSMEKMNASQEELEHRKRVYFNWKELNDILGNANGDKFRETAQCFTLRFLVRQANEQLRMLNRRYSLEQVADSLGIRVIDHDRADEVRNISSLSGGETFLVSLALALGLSSLSSRNIPMANLFVDEGFGTLDSSNLNLVIDALSNLQSMQGKKVGVISHTTEMKERIRTQIQVQKVGSGGKSVLKIL